MPKNKEYIRENFFSLDIPQHIREVFIKESKKNDLSKAEKYIKKTLAKISNQDNLLSIIFQPILLPNQAKAEILDYELIVSLSNSSGTKNIIEMHCLKGEKIPHIAIPMFPEASISLDTNLGIKLINLNAANPLKIISDSNITIEKCSGFSALSCSTNKDVNIHNELSVNGDVLLSSSVGACNIDANLKISGTLAAKGKDLNLSKTTQTGKNLYLHGEDSLKHGTAKIEACGDVQLYAVEKIQYNLENILTNKNTAIVLKHAADMQLSFDKNLDYHVFSTELVSLELTSNRTFGEYLRIFAPYCDIKIGSTALAARIESKIVKVYLNNLNICHGGLFGKQTLIAVVSDTLRGGELTNNRTVQYGEYIKNNSAFIGSDYLMILQAQNKIKFEDCMIQCISGNSVIRTPDLHITTGKMLIAADCCLDATSANIDIVYCNPPTGRSTRFEIPKTAPSLNYSIRWVHAAQQILTPPTEIYVYGTLGTRPGLKIVLIGSELHYGSFNGDTLPTSQDIQQYLILNGANHFRKNLYNYETPLPPRHALTSRGIIQSITDVRVHTPNQDLLSQGRLMSGGSIIAYTRDLQIGNATFTFISTPPEFNTSAPLFGDYRTFGMYKVANYGAPIYLIPTVSMHRLELTNYPPVVLLPSNKIMVDNSRVYSKFRDNTDEVTFIFPQLTKRLFSSVLTGMNADPISAWNILQLNAQQWIAKNPQYLEHITKNEIDATTQPMLYYVLGEHDWHSRKSSILEVQLYLPTMLYEKIKKCYAEGWFAKNIEAHCRDILVHSNIDAENMTQLELTGKLSTVRPRNFVKRTITEESSSRSLFGKTTKQSTREITDVNINPNYANIRGGTTYITAQFASLEGDLESRINNTKLKTKDGTEVKFAISTKHKHNEASASRGLTKKTISEYVAIHSIVQPVISSKLKTSFETENGDIVDRGAIFYSTDESFEAKNGTVKSESAVILQQAPTKLSKSGPRVKEEHITQELAVPSQHIARDSIQHEAGDRIHHSGTHMYAPKISLSATNGVKISAKALNNFIVSTTTGFANAFTYMDATTENLIQSVVQPVIGGFKLLEVSTQSGDIEFESAQVYGVQNSKFILKAKNENSDIKVTTLKLQNHSKNKTRTVGLSFTASDAIAAIAQGNVKDAFVGLAREVPLLSPLASLRDGGHSEDIMAQGMLLAYRLRDSFKNGAFDNPTNFANNIKQQFGFAPDVNGDLKWDIKNLRASILVGETTVEEYSSQVVGSMIAVWDIVFQAARDVDLHSVEIEGKTLTVNAGGKINIVADDERSQRKEKYQSLSLGVSKQTANLGAEFSHNKESTQTYKTTSYTLEDSISLKSGEEVNVKGALLDTAVAFISTKRLLVETLLDKQNKSSLSVSASTTGDLGYKTSAFDSEWAEMQSEIRASTAFYINAEEKIGLKAGVLSVGDAALTYLINDGTELYQIEMPADGDDLFHALGISRLKATDDLLQNYNDMNIRQMIAHDIARFLKANQLPRILASSPEALALYNDYIGNGSSNDLEQAIMEYSLREDSFRSFVAFFVNIEGSNLSFNLANPHEPGTISAIAELNNLAVKTWVKDENEILHLINTFEGKKDIAREVNLFATISESSTDNRLNFSLLTDNPMCIMTPVITHEHLRGFKKGSGYGVNGGTLFNLSGEDKTKDHSTPYIIGTMFRENAEQQNNAAILNKLSGKVKIINQNGGEVDTSGIIKDPTNVQINGAPHRIGLGFAMMFPADDKLKKKAATNRVRRQEPVRMYSAGDVYPRYFKMQSPVFESCH